MPTTVSGTILQTPEPGILQVLEDHLVTIDDGGVITSVAPRGGVVADRTLGSDEVLLPGLIDTHIHAPQWPQLGTALDLPLDQWLNDHTFPLEARFVDLGFALRAESSKSWCADRTRPTSSMSGSKESARLTRILPSRSLWGITLGAIWCDGVMRAGKVANEWQLRFILKTMRSDTSDSF